MKLAYARNVQGAASRERFAGPTFIICVTSVLCRHFEKSQLPEESLSGVLFCFPYFLAGTASCRIPPAGPGGVAVQIAQHPKYQRPGGIRDLGAQLGFAPAIKNRCR